MDLPERMRLRREELNMSQRELAAKLGYSTVGSNIYKIESGGNGLPLSKLCKLAEVLETTPNWLLGWGGAKTLKFQHLQPFQSTPQPPP